MTLPLERPAYATTLLASLALLSLAACTGDLGGDGDGDGESGGTGTSAGNGAGPGSGGDGPSAGGGSTSSAASGGAGTGGNGSGGGDPPGLVPTFVAQGHLGRTTISCDDGKTWIHNASVDDGARCFENGLDCDHTSGAGRGLAYGDGWWVATFGWGEPGEVRRSKDGITWAPVITGTTFADIAYGNGVWMANNNPPRISTDAGTWEETPAGYLPLEAGNVRAIQFIDFETGRFVITAESGEVRDIMVSSDGGQTFWHPSSRPDQCLSYARGLASGNGVAVAASGNGHVCTSIDGGDTWTVVELGDSLSSNPIWDGAQFLVWKGSTVYRSADGLEWTSETTDPPDVSIGAVARASNGTIVASNDGWMTWYEDQKFYRSTDGVAWEVLDAGKFTGSHPINFIEFGFAEPSADCPAP